MSKYLITSNKNPIIYDKYNTFWIGTFTFHTLVCFPNKSSALSLMHLYLIGVFVYCGKVKDLSTSSSTSEFCFIKLRWVVWVTLQKKRKLLNPVAVSGWQLQGYDTVHKRLES